MTHRKKRGSIILLVAVFFLIGVLTTGLLTYFSERQLSTSSVKRQMEQWAAEISVEVKEAVTEYPGHQWLVRYWYAHAQELDIEYDASFDLPSETAQKCAIFAQRHPELQLRYLNTAQLESLSPEDQKLCAEILYSWLITRLDEIKRSCDVNYLFCVITEEPYQSQFFLFSAADPGAVRGTSYEEVYPLGHQVSVEKSQTEAMGGAIRNSNHLADAGNYVDYYTFLMNFDGKSVLIGLTYDLSSLLADIQDQTLTGATLALLNQLFLSVICLVLIFVFVLRPLKKVQASIRSYKETTDSAAVVSGLSEVRSRNEIGQLSEDVTEMVREIDAHIEEIQAITAEKERIGAELSLATKIQASMLPSTFPPFPERQEFDLYASMDPAKEVGGDFYDFFLVDQDHLALVIADVAGKGIPAALFMMVTKLLINTSAMSGLSPAQVLEAVNHQICVNNPEEMFVTVWLGILELSTGKLTAANAGHEYPVLWQPGQDCALYKDPHGFVIGGMDEMKYKNYSLQLTPGAKIFVYTDGVPEANNSKEGLFTTERMLEALNRDPEATPRQLLKNVRSAVDSFVGEAEQFDDLTMLCLEYRGTENKG